MSDSRKNETGSNCGTTRARAILALFVLAALFFVSITFSPLKSGFADAPSRGPGDVELYRAEVDRIRAGQPYYDAAEAELHSRGYPTRSVFNWRTPLPVWLVGTLGEITASKIVLGLLGLLLVVLSFQFLADDESVPVALFGVLLLSGALLPCVLDDLLVMPELWSGVLMALSVVCLGIERRKAGVAAGVAALFFRELAAPYCLLCAVVAAGQRRYRELGWWTLGFAAFGAFYSLHLWHVLPRISAAGTAHAHGWIRFGGAGFLISTVQMNAYLLMLPQWASAVYLACALLGCATWNTPSGRLVAWTVSLYAVAFSVAGHDFNQYWGSLTAPLTCLAACRAPRALGELATTAGLNQLRLLGRLRSAGT